MDKNRLQYLHEKYINDQMSPDELQEWKAAVSSSGSEQLIQEIMDSHWLATTGQENRDIKTGRFEEMYQNIIAHQRPTRTIRPRWTRIAIAAAVATIIFGAGLFYFNGAPGSKTSQITYKNDVNPGVHGATLTLASGKKIRLSNAANGELAKEAGVVITKSADGKLVYETEGPESGANNMNILETANGETYQVRLPDGSLVYLNAASSLTYSPTLMEQGKRIVRLQGEAFFEIAKVTLPAQPKRVSFIVETGSQRVEVLGTHFNVMAYRDEPAVSTTLVEGIVKVSSSGGSGSSRAFSDEVLLKPGQQALNDGQTIKVSQANLENITDWKDGDFFLNHVNFKTAMRKIERWYNVKMIYDHSVPDDIEAGGWISRNRTLSAVLNLIESTGQVHFKVDGRKVYVYR
jgi:transmembrane sensor